MYKHDGIAVTVKEVPQRRSIDQGGELRANLLRSRRDGKARASTGWPGGQAIEPGQAIINAASRPPVCRPYIDPLGGFCFDPPAQDTPAGEHEGVRPLVVDDAGRWVRRSGAQE